MLRSRGSAALAPVWGTFIFAVALVTSYNIDVLVPVIKKGEDATAFSLSLAPFRNEKGTTFILAGSPLGQSSTITNASLTGAVYACPLAGNEDNCYEIGNQFMDDSLGLRMERQLYGQSLAVYQTLNDSQSRIYSCAPLFRRYLTNKELNDLPASYYPVGICVRLNGSLMFDRTENLCELVDFDKDEHYMCMGGVSATATDKYFAIGAPGAYDQRGSGISLVEPDGADRAVFSRDPIIDATKYIADQDKYRHPDLTYYLGYSISVEQHISSPRLVLGSPRGSDINIGSSGPIIPGSAVLMKFSGTQLKAQRTFYGSQMGEGFGYSVYIIDIDHDGDPETIIGAPYNAESSRVNEGKVYIQERSRASVKELLPNVRSNNALFGAAVSSPGDLDKDGYEDIIIGAPGEGDIGSTSGAVYVYLGRKRRDGYLEFSQVIRARDHATLIGIRSFGFTLAHSEDLDGNNYPDVLVGAFETGHAVLLRTRPIVIVTAQVDSMDHISLDDRTCTEEDIFVNPQNAQRRNYTCFTITTSLDFSLKNDHDSTNSIMPIFYNLTLDYDHPDGGRLLFAKTLEKSKTDTVVLNRGQKVTIESLVFISPFIVDRLTPFVIRLEYHEPETFDKVVPTRRDADSLPNLYPVIQRDANRAEVLFVDKSVSVALNCDNKDGFDGCNPDLVPQVELTFANNLPNSKYVHDDHLVAGSGPIAVLNISISNLAEEAHQTEVRLLLPPRVTYKNSSTIYKAAGDEDDVKCEIADDYDINYVGYTEIDCDVANPLRKNQKKIFLVRLQNSLIGNEGNLTIFLNTSSKGIEIGQKDTNNGDVKTFSVHGVSDLKLTGTFFQNNIKAKLRYKTLASSIPRSPRTFEDLGHEITHRYTVRNFGPTTVYRMDLTIWWPVQTKDRRDLFYLRNFGIPGDQETYKCDATKYLDKCGYADGLPVGSGGCEAVFDDEIVEPPPPECDDYFCVPIHCQINRTLVRRAGFQIIINATAVARTLQENYTKIAPRASSVLQAHLYDDYFRGQTKFTFSILSRLQPQPEEYPLECVPFWIIMASVLGGLLIWAVIVLLLYLCGFFKRKSKGEYRVRRKTYKTASPTALSPGPGEVAFETDSKQKSRNGGEVMEMKTRKERSKSPGSGSRGSQNDKKPSYEKENTPL